MTRKISAALGSDERSRWLLAGVDASFQAHQEELELDSAHAGKTPGDPGGQHH